MANGGPFETVIQQMLSSNNEARQAAETAFNEAKSNPDGLVGNLVRVLRNSPEAESRALCAVMLRKVGAQSITSEQAHSFSRAPLYLHCHKRA